MKRLVAAAVLLLLSAAACGQVFPTRPVRLVVGFTPGGGVDINARLLAAKLSELFGQQVIVDNKPGAGTNIANEHVAKAAPDGYTLLFTSPAFAVNMSLHKNPPYDAIRDFSPVSVFSESTNLLVVPASLPAKSVQGLIGRARSTILRPAPEPRSILRASCSSCAPPRTSFTSLTRAARPRSPR